MNDRKERNYHRTLSGTTDTDSTGSSSLRGLPERLEKSLGGGCCQSSRKRSKPSTRDPDSSPIRSREHQPESPTPPSAESEGVKGPFCLPVLDISTPRYPGWFPGPWPNSRQDWTTKPVLGSALLFWSRL